MLPGGMGKKRLAYNAVVSAINNKNITNPLPEGSTMPWSMPTPSSASTPQTETLCPATNKHTMIPTAINIVVSGGEETSANERLPDIKVAPTPPVHSPVLPKQAAALRRLLNEALPLVEAVPEWRELVVFNEKHSESNTCSPTLETARKQLEVVKMPSTEGEGQYLERAVAYIRERMNRRSSACDAFMPRTWKVLHDKTMAHSETRRYSQDVVSAQETMSVLIHSPKSTAALTLPILLFPPALRHPSDEPFEAASKENEGVCLKRVMAHALERPHTRLAEYEVGRHVAALTPLVAKPNSPSAPVAPANSNDAGLQSLNVISNENKASVMRSPEDESERAEELSLNPSKAVAEQPEDSPNLPPVRKQGELLVEAANTERSDERPTRRKGPTLLAPANARPPDMMELRRPSQEAVSSKELSVLLHPPESAAAHTQHTPTLDAFPVQSPSRSSSEHEIQLCWKPPNCEEESRRQAYRAVNDRIQPSILKCLPTPGTAATLSISRSSLAHIMQAVPCCLSHPPRWRVHMPSVGAETVQRQGAIAISTRINTSAMHSPVYGVMLTLPIRQLACSARVNTAHCRDDELVWRLRKPPDPTAKHWLLDEAINELKGGWNRSHLPAPRPELAPLVRSHSLWPASTCSPAVVSLLALSAQVTEPCHWKDGLAWRVLKHPEVMKHWLLEEAINKTMKEGRRERLPAAGPMSTLYARSPLPCRSSSLHGTHRCLARQRKGLALSLSYETLQIMCYTKNMYQVN